VTDTVSAIVSSRTAGRAIPALYVGLAGDTPHAPSTRITLRGIDRVAIGRGDKRDVARGEQGGTHLLTLTLVDTRMSTQHVRLTRLGRSWVVEDMQSKNGTWIGGKRIEKCELSDGEAILVGHTMLVFRSSGGDEPDLDQLVATPGLATLSPVLAARFEQVAIAARSRVSIEIFGETGTGKELVARAIHTHSSRSGAFVAINCGALADSLLEGELFGHRKGAYTGADSERLGLVRAADRGTLFLDEVAELSPAAQTALLRVLQEGEVVPVGEDRPIKLDVRIVTATHKNLDDQVDEGRFRADLRARLLGIQIALPALRDRPEDLGMLVGLLLSRIAPERDLGFAADAVTALYAHPWPMNIRELERVLGGAIVLARDRIELEHLPEAFRDRGSGAATTLSAEERQTRDRLVEALGRHAGNLTAVARELGKDRTQLRRWMTRFGITRE
jgi:DNA-binding NtrC family response regulator